MSDSVKTLVFFVLVALIGFIAFKLYDRKAREVILKTKLEFKALNSENFLRSNVKEVYCPPEVRCATPPVWIVLSDGRKFGVNAHYDLERKFTLSSIISVGDSLVKMEGSDTLFVFENHKMSRFLIK